MPKTREENIATVEWRPDPPYGCIDISFRMLWHHQVTDTTKPDIKSLVNVTEPPTKYTDEELERIAEFSDAVKRYELERWPRLRGGNLIFLDKDPKGHPTHPWVARRINWEHARRYLTLEEALEAIDEERAVQSKSVQSSS